MTLTQKIDSLIEKAKRLKETSAKVVSKNDSLEQQLKELKTQLYEKEKEMVALGEKIKIIKLAQNMGSTENGEPNITELKRKINEYIKEIDQCITLLND